jgi:magnesium-transporting ATPase (P-type)
VLFTDLPRAALAAAAITFAGIPLALPVAAALGLALAARRARRSGVQLRRLSALDTFGAMTTALVEPAAAGAPGVPGPAELPEGLAAAGVDVIVATGESPIHARAQLRRRGWTVEPEKLRAGLASGDKIREVARLQSEGQVVALAGDLLGDLPALRQADVSFRVDRPRSPVVAHATEIAADPARPAALVAALHAGRRVYAGLELAAVLIGAGLIAGLVTALPAVLGAPPAISVAQLLGFRLFAELPLALGLTQLPAGEPAQRPRGRRRLLFGRAALPAALAIGAGQALVALVVFVAILGANGWPPERLPELGAQLAAAQPAAEAPEQPAPGRARPEATTAAAPAGTAVPAPVTTPGPEALPDGALASADPATIKPANSETANGDPVSGDPVSGDPAARSAEALDRETQAARQALARAQAGALTALLLVTLGAALALAFQRVTSDVTRLVDTLLPLWTAIGATLVALAIALGLEPLQQALGLAWPDAGPWLIGLAIGLTVALSGLIWRFRRADA